VKTKELA